MSTPDISNIEFESMDLNKKVTIKSYFKQMLKMLWREGEGFSSKRPFGNSGWEFDVYIVLAENGLVSKGEEDWKEAERLIFDMIDNF